MRTMNAFLNVSMSVVLALRQFLRLVMWSACILVILSGCDQAEVDHAIKAPRITATFPESRDVIVSHNYTCQIHAVRYVDIRSTKGGMLEAAEIKNDQPVKRGDLLCTVKPLLSDAEVGEANLAILQYEYLKKIKEQRLISICDGMQEVARMEKAHANADRAEKKMTVALIQAPFDGIITHLMDQQGSIVQPQDVLATLSDNSTLCVSFHVPEKHYLAYMANTQNGQQELKVELILADGSKFAEPGKIAAIAGNFDDRTGMISYRADFANPDRLPLHGQPGTVAISRVQHDVILIPQRATFEVQQKRYLFWIDNNDVAHRREIEVDDEFDDQYIIRRGLNARDKVVVDGVHQVRDGQMLHYEIDPRK